MLIITWLEAKKSHLHQIVLYLAQLEAIFVIDNYRYILNSLAISNFVFEADLSMYCEIKVNIRMDLRAIVFVLWVLLN